MRLSRGKLDDPPRPEHKIHFLDRDRKTRRHLPACGQTVTSFSTTAERDVTCKKCLVFLRSLHDQKLSTYSDLPQSRQ